MANADLTKISVFIFFDKTYLQKPHCIMIEYISSNKAQLQLRFVFKNKDLKRLFITSPSLHWFPQVVVWTLAITHTSCKDLKVESDFSTIFSLSENCHPDKHKHKHTHTHTHTNAAPPNFYITPLLFFEKSVRARLMDKNVAPKS